MINVRPAPLDPDTLRYAIQVVNEARNYQKASARLGGIILKMERQKHG